MAWVRLHDGAMSNLKVVCLSDSAFRLWIRGLCYCQTALTDGLIPREALRDMGAKRKDVEELSTAKVDGRSPLWEPHAVGFKVHDYIRPVINGRRQNLRRYLVELLSHWGESCVYCGRSALDLQIEHIVPIARGGSNDLSNLALACRQCNIQKRTQTAAEFGYPHIHEMTIQRH